MTVARPQQENAVALRLTAWTGLPVWQWLGARALYALSFLLGLALWEFVASLLPRVVFASPSRVAVKLIEGFANGTIPIAFAGSLQHFALGFAIAFAIALPAGLLIGRRRTASMMFSPVLDALFSIPSVAFVPFIMIWFGLYFEARVALVVAMSVLDMLVTIAAGARNIDPAAIDVARSFGITGWRRVRSVYMPASLPFIFTALRIGVVRAVNAMITAELFFAAVDLGKIMQTASSRFDAATMLGVVALVSLFGLLLQELVKASEAKLIPWCVREAA
jgi:ABC-type nitrate/sulfonate/bicarbonate transport system permease component